MKRIVIHWTAGAHTPSNLDKEHYHYIIDGAGNVVKGKWPVIANAAPEKGKYAAHTLNCNTGAIGVAVAAMAGAQDRPFNAGAYPITPEQVTALFRLCADLCDQYKIPVTRQTVLTHAEVQPTLGIKQKGKWDITWLPGFSGPEDAVKTGDYLRSYIAAAGRPSSVKVPSKPEHDASDVSAKPVAVNTTPETDAKPGFWVALFNAIFGRI